MTLTFCQPPRQFYAWEYAGTAGRTALQPIRTTRCGVPSHSHSQTSRRVDSGTASPARTTSAPAVAVVATHPQHRRIPRPVRVESRFRDHHSGVITYWDSWLANCLPQNGK